MSGETDFSSEERARVLRLVDDGRLQYSQDWLRQRAQSFLSGGCSRHAGQPWGWKEPNTHIIIDHLLETRPDLRYIHFIRHPLDMALSTNQNQLENWGPVFLNRDVANAPRQSLAYWCAAHRRINAVMRRWPERIMTMDFDALCADPKSQSARVARFLDVEFSDESGTELGKLIDHKRLSSGRFKAADLTQFNADDMSYVKELGYVV
jgi:sulfotransferase family protein